MTTATAPGVRGRRLLAAAAGLALTVGLGACGSSTSTTSPATPAGPPYPVSITHLTLTDRSRPTAAGPQTPAQPSRTLETTVFFPDTDADAGNADQAHFPLIVFAHGLTGSPARHSDLAEAWARAGFVVALPAFPLTNSTVPGGWGNAPDVANQPGDVSFVIDQLVAADDDPMSALHSRIDPERIGVSGHSLGAATTYAITFDACCRDPRVDAAVVMAGVVLVDADGMDHSISTPALVFHGDADELLPYQQDRDTWAALAPPTWFVTLHGAGHSPPYEDADSAWDDVVETTSTDFWLAQLNGDDAARARLETDATVAGISSIESDRG